MATEQIAGTLARLKLLIKRCTGTTSFQNGWINEMTAILSQRASGKAAGQTHLWEGG